VTEPATGTYLDEILAHKRQEVVERFASKDAASMRRVAGRRSDQLSLAAALKRPGVQVIAEIKRRSPRGELRPDADAAQVAAAYHKGGAAAVSVLTDDRYFGGSLADLMAVYTSASRREGLVVLRKDFIIDERQVVESAVWGADAILLIVAALGAENLKKLLGLNTDLGLEALVEVHDESELEIALSADATIIGVNNRDLRSFTTDLAVSERLLPTIPGKVAGVAESGIASRPDVTRMAAAGADGVLVGEALMKASDPTAAVQELLGC
jgi:indole-3-glycerol phosphate synthase